MPEIQTYTAGIDQKLRHPTHKVFMRTHWQSEWVEVEYCRAVGQVAWMLPPNFSSATLEWQYGLATRPLSTTTEVVEPFHPSNLIGSYVKIEWDASDVPDEESEDYRLPVFYGVVVGVVDPWGSDGAGPDDEPVARGMQRFTVHGMESLLDMTPIMSSHVMTIDDEDQQQITEIGRCLQFNKINAGAVDHRQRLEGNMTSLYVEDEVNCFDGSGGSPSEDEEADFDPPIPWTLAHIVAYLLHFHSPKDANGDQIVKFSVRRNACFDGLIEHEISVDDYENMTIWRLLNQLVDRRRGLGWRLEPVDKEVDGEDGGTELAFEVVLFAFVAEEVELPIGGELVPDQDRVFVVDVSYDHLAQVVVHTDGHLKYHQVVARGARRGAIVNLSNDNDIGDARIPIDPDWSTADDDALADDWENGVTEIPGYKDLLLEQQKAARDRYRRLHKFDRLWSHFTIGRAWNGLTESERPVFPQINEEGEATDESEKFWLPGLRLSRTLPLLAGVDYSGERIANVEDNPDESILADIRALPPNAHPEYLPLQCFLNMNHGGEIAWRPVDALGLTDGISGGWPYTVSCTTQDTGPGFVLKVRGGGRVTQRVLSGMNAPAGDDGAGQGFSVDALNRVLVVAYLQSDQFVEHRIPLDENVEDADGEAPDVIRRMVIPMPDCHLDWVPRYTVVGYHVWKEGEEATAMLNYKLASTDKAAWLRDDRKRLKTAAELAAKWYLVTRKPITISWKRLRKFFQVGDFIATLKQVARMDNDAVFELDVNTPVTAVRYDLGTGTTTVQTAFAELDVRGVSR
jgi:hypothetical protein